MDYVRRKTSVPAVLVIALLALGLSGFSYAHWTDQLNVQGTINTGNICAEYSPPIAVGDLGPDWMYVEGVGIVQVPGAKDVGSTVVGLQNVDGHAKILTVTINNAYPYYATSIDFHVHNCGSVPITMYQAIFDPEASPGVKVNQTITHTGVVYLDLNGDGQQDVMILWSGIFGNQIDPCFAYMQDMSFIVVVLQPAPQGAHLTFLVELDFMNWNEYVPPPP
jgi:predicted ribosomally synthesized peptide with SipW-like signal peptide